MPILAQVELASVTGIPADNVINTFSFITPAGFQPQLDQIPNALIDFYNGANTGPPPLSTYLSLEMSRAAGAVTIRQYDIAGALSGGPTGSPVRTSQHTLVGNAPALPFPGEVAMVLTLRGTDALSSAVEAPDGGDPGTAPDRPRARKTGRIYFGPTTQGGATSGPPVRPDSVFREALLDAGQRLYSGLAPLGIIWSVWSRADGALRGMTSLQVDDAYDTQRRRGVAATLRETRVL